MKILGRTHRNGLLRTYFVRIGIGYFLGVLPMLFTPIESWFTYALMFIIFCMGVAATALALFFRQVRLWSKLLDDGYISVEDVPDEVRERQS